MRLLLSQINTKVGDLKGNTEKILAGMHQGRHQRADIAVFPELALTGYPPEDMLLLPHFMQAVQASLNEIIAASTAITAIVGLPRYNPDYTEKALYNSAAVIQNGALLGFQDKILLPTYDVFFERRYFEPGSGVRVWNIGGQSVGITICEDLWQHSELLKFTSYRNDPVMDLEPQHPDLMLNLSASPYSFDKIAKRLQVGARTASTLHCPVALCNLVGGNDSLIFDGHSYVMNSKGELAACAKGFEEDALLVDLAQALPPKTVKFDKLEDLYKALVLGLHDYFRKSGFKKACLGISGGIDSALAACIAVEALGKENVLGVCMPSRYSSKESTDDSRQLAKNLGIKLKEIPIESPFASYLDLLEPQFDGKPPDATEENLQARIRGMILMALSNKLGYIVLSTGNKSELAMGYATLYGDMCGGLGVINDVSKMQVYALSKWINRHEEIIPISTIQKEPSAELHPNQKDIDSLPPYAIVDQVLQSYVEEHQAPEAISHQYKIPPAVVNDLISRIHRNEYKRRQSPPGLRVTEQAFSAGRRFPIVQGFVN